jgi:hypothetical protein
MSFAAVNKAIKAKFMQGWTNGVKVVGDNDAEVKAVKEWCRLSIRPAESNQASMGASTNTTRSVGVVMVSIFVQPGNGSERAWQLVDQAVAALQYERVSGTNWNVQFQAASPREIGQPAGAAYYQMTVTVNYYFDVTA